MAESKAGKMVEKKAEKITKNISMTAIAVAAVLLVIISAAAGYLIKDRIEAGKKPEIEATGITDRIQEIGELATAELTYNGLVQYEEGDIPFINLKRFAMKYRADVKAGIEVSKVSVEVKENVVEITLPEVEILSLKIDSDSIEFYDTAYAIFNWTKKENVVDAIKAAEEDVMLNADIEGLKARAVASAEFIIKELLSDLPEGYTVVFKQAPTA